jgi:hypothetical protein
VNGRRPRTNPIVAVIAIGAGLFAVAAFVVAIAFRSQAMENCHNGNEVRRAFVATVEEIEELVRGNDDVQTATKIARRRLPQEVC